MKNTGMYSKFCSSHCCVVRDVGFQVHDIILWDKLNYLYNDISLCFIVTA